MLRRKRKKFKVKSLLRVGPESKQTPARCGCARQKTYPLGNETRRATADFKVQEVHGKPIRSLSFLDTLLRNI